jgi:hypothetical protein
MKTLVILTNVFIFIGNPIKSYKYYWYSHYIRIKFINNNKSLKQ